jgi:hypothetical protein
MNSITREALHQVEERIIVKKRSVEDQRVAFRDIAELIREGHSCLSLTEEEKIETIGEFLEESIDTYYSIREHSCAENEIPRFGRMLAFAGYHYEDLDSDEREAVVSSAIKKLKVYRNKIRYFPTNPVKFYADQKQEKMELLNFLGRMYFFLESETNQD